MNCETQEPCTQRAARYLYCYISACFRIFFIFEFDLGPHVGQLRELLRISDLSNITKKRYQKDERTVNPKNRSLSLLLYEGEVLEISQK